MRTSHFGHVFIKASFVLFLLVGFLALAPFSTRAATYASSNRNSSAHAVAASPRQDIGVGQFPTSVAKGDFNKDGNTDLAITNAGGNTVSILLGKGDGNGTFAPAVNYTVGAGPSSVDVGDFNKDGKPDLAVANGGTNTVSILLGNGDGSFAPAVNYTVGGQPYSIVVSDFNKDGKLDLAVANFNDSTVSILLGNGNGTFQSPTTKAAGLFPDGLAVADFNKDGKPDLAIVDSGSNSFDTLFGTL